MTNLIWSVSISREEAETLIKRPLSSTEWQGFQHILNKDVHASIDFLIEEFK
jgi:hypothetical protein